MEFIAHNLAPIMFAGLICFLLIGFPVAFSLGACGLFFAFIGIELNVLPEALMQACRCASTASCRTTRCWRFPSSPDGPDP
jgi:TRAP-type mannitol/chloroaromatic compound transport system permease large subunit